jgi:hypothetical protein
MCKYNLPLLGCFQGRVHVGLNSKLEGKIREGNRICWYGEGCLDVLIIMTLQQNGSKKYGMRNTK